MGKGDRIEGITKVPDAVLHDKPFEFVLHTGKEIVQQEIPAQSFLVQDLITTPSITMLAGEEGCGKSIVAMNLAVAVASGKDKWLSYDVSKHGPVLYLNNELSRESFARRLKQMASGITDIETLNSLVVPEDVPPLSVCGDAIFKVCAESHPCLLVLDCLYFAHNEDENDSSSMKALMRQFVNIRNQFELSVLLVHHLKKNSQRRKMHNDQIRGSNVFGGVTDAVLMMRRSGSDPTRRIIAPTKFRDVGDEQRQCRLLSLDGDRLLFNDEGPTDESEHFASSDAPTASERIVWSDILEGGREYSRSDIIELCSPLGYDDRTVDRQLRAAREAGVLRSPRHGHYAL